MTVSTPMHHYLMPFTDDFFTSGTVNHSYPFCWRSETPLIYKAVPSWFVRVESMVENLLENNSKTYWVPDFVKEKRFANWLRDARDWYVCYESFGISMIDSVW